MATSSRSEAAMDGRNGGFYKCDECTKAFNRMASYEAHIRMHAQDELDVLDLVFNYSEKMHEASSSAGRRAETRSRPGARSSSRSSNPPEPKLTLSPPAAPQQGERVLVAEKPRPIQPDCGSQPVRLVDLLTNGRNCTDDGNGVSSTAATLGAYPSTSPQLPKRDRAQPSPFRPFSKGWLPFRCRYLFKGVVLAISISLCSDPVGGGAVLVINIPSQSAAESGGEEETRGYGQQLCSVGGDGGEETCTSLIVKVPLRFCSGSLMRRPVINLTKGASSFPGTLQQYNKRQPIFGSSVKRGKDDPSTSKKTTPEKLKSVEFDVKERKGKSISPSKTSPRCMFLPTKSRIVRLDSLGLPESSNLSDKLCSPVGMSLPLQSKKTSTRYQCSICHRFLSSNSSLKRHNLLHTGERPFKCSLCDNSFTQPHHRLNHELGHWAIVGPSQGQGVGSSLPHRRVYGGSVSSTASVSSSSPENEHERVLKCKHCDQTFSTLRGLREHLTIHDSNRQIACSVCGMRFLKQAHCSIHMQIHSPSRRISCPYCGKKIDRSERFEKHVLQHRIKKVLTNQLSQQARYVCKYCPKACLSLSGLTRHVSVHFPPKKKPSKYPLTVEKGEVARRTGEGTESEVREILSVEQQPKKDHLPGVFSGMLDLDLELDSDSDSDDERGNGEETVTEGEMGDVSNSGAGTTEESMDEVMETVEGKGGGERGSQVNVREKDEEESSDGEDAMSPLRLDTDDSSEETEEEEDEEFSYSFSQSCVSFSQSCVQTKSQTSGMPYRNPHNHQKGKTGAVPQYKCEWCGRMFLRRYYLQQHYVLHQQVPHQCQLCGKVFMSLRYLKRHLRSRHDAEM